MYPLRTWRHEHGTNPRTAHGSTVLSVVLVVLAAMANATASVLQRKADRDEPDGEGSASGLALLWELAHKPVWFAGIGAIIVGFLLQAGALATGPIALVQPILVLELAFTLLLAGMVFHNRLHAREWTAILGMTDVPHFSGLICAPTPLVPR